MGQAGNSNRHASLDDHKERAAGRNNEREQIREAVNPRTKGAAGGAFGPGGKADRGGGVASQGAGGGGGGPAPGRDEVAREAGRSVKPPRKRKA